MRLDINALLVQSSLTLLYMSIGILQIKVVKINEKATQLSWPDDKTQQ